MAASSGQGGIEEAMSKIERRAYIENVAAQEAAYWYCREHGIHADDFVIGQILQVAGPIILQDSKLTEIRLYAEKMIRDRDQTVQGCGADILGIIDG